EEAQADLDAIQARLARQYPKTDADIAIRIHPLKETAIGEVSSSLWILFASVTVLLLIACTNIGGLMLARTADRQQEISVRLSLGASRARVAMQLLIEAFLVALAGAALGLVFANVAFAVLGGTLKGLPRIDEVRLDWTLVGYTIITTVCCTLL